MMLLKPAARNLALRLFSAKRFASSDAKVVVVGAGKPWFLAPQSTLHRVVINPLTLGAAGLTVVSQLHNSLRKHGKTFAKEDIVIVDPAQYHYYQPGW
jgi:hypothetical protein